MVGARGKFLILRVARLLEKVFPGLLPPPLENYLNPPIPSSPPLKVLKNFSPPIKMNPKIKIPPHGLGGRGHHVLGSGQQYKYKECYADCPSEVDCSKPYWTERRIC